MCVCMSVCIVKTTSPAPSFPLEPRAHANNLPSPEIEDANKLVLTGTSRSSVTAYGGEPDGVLACVEAH